MLTAGGTGIELSNAVQVASVRTHVMVARESRYKLIADAISGDQRLFDLQADPFEQVDLLALGALPPPAASAYQTLLDHLQRLYPDGSCAPGCTTEVPAPVPPARGAQNGQGALTTGPKTQAGLVKAAGP